MRRERNAERSSTRPPKTITRMSRNARPTHSRRDGIRVAVFCMPLVPFHGGRRHAYAVFSRCLALPTRRRGRGRRLLLEDVDWASLDLLVNPADVFAQETQRAKDAAAQDVR